MRVSIIIATFKRANLLDLGLWSLSRQNSDKDIEIVVVNDGIEDDTAKVCDSYRSIFNIKYIFSGQRNKDIIKSRIPGFALNIGVKQSSGDIIILTCPEIFHLSNSVDLIANELISNDNILATPNVIYFDDDGETTNKLLLDRTIKVDVKKVNRNRECTQATQMPYFMGMYKKAFMDINGYDEDFIGYAGDDSDLIGRLRSNGLKHQKTFAEVIHLFHGATNDGRHHYNNPDWVYNYNLFMDRKGRVVRNENREWGVL
jgi:glycosyltransferase involved in cell wall biosynthesis